ncbi:hypothetical protein SLS55_008473 [Diplodia seriata]|uniref:Uncharacterized protein n=1 Tax=Diplodia seriata TaxID=420778 RepID=A0A1S8BF68_9PEZI|nr:hypothetical protein BK809_0003309 [Diplodia seriata]
MAGSINPRFDPFGPGAEAFDGPDGEFDDIDWNDPASFSKILGSGLPVPKPVSPGEVRAKTRSHSAQIFQAWHFLNATIERHETTVQKRWLKKTKEQRRKVLLSAWPNMSTTHRPDFEAFTRESEYQRTAVTKFADSYMFPYINQEDLLKPRTLLLMLNARARNPPDAFAMADHEAAHLGYAVRALVAPYLNEYTIMFTARRSPDTYGELLSWDDHPEAFEWLTSGKGIHPGYGLHILEIQERVLKFLVDCCKLILHDIQPEAMISDEFSIQPEPPSLSENETGFSSLAVVASEAPYRPPASLDLKRLESLVASKLSAAEDHVWALREDPGYFADCVTDYQEHRQEMIPDSNGKPHPIFKPGRENVFWNRVIGELIANAYLRLELWKEFRDQIANLRLLQTKYAQDISIEKDLPEEYLTALLKLQHYLNHATKGPIGQLKQGVVASPPLRRFFVREPPDDPQSARILVREKPGSGSDQTRQRLVWLFNAIWDDERRFLAGITILVDELERLLQNDANARELTSRYIVDVISDLAVMVECIRHIKLYQPWAQTFESHMVGKEEGFKKDWAERTKGWVQFLAVADGTVLASLGNPSDKKFFYPVDKRRTRDNVEAMRRAEQNLDLFWSKVDEHMLEKKRSLDNTAVRQLLSQPRILQRTPEWVEPAKAPTAPSGDVHTLCKPLSELYFDLEQRTERTIDRSGASAPKSKGKTKGTAQTSDESGTPPAEPLERHRPDKQPVFVVDKRAQKVFSTLFYTPSASSLPGEVTWTDFLHAMSSTGFTPEKLYGSVWQFSPTKLDVERSIQFHEPHPSGKIPIRTARRHGRRLNRAYGWHGGMFVLA